MVNSNLARMLPLLFAFLEPASPQPSAVSMQEFAQAWKASRAYTLSVAEAMPAESYGFRPTPGEFSFAQQMLHLAHANYGWFTAVMGEERTIPDAKIETKADVVAYLGRTFDYCLAALDRVSPDRLNASLPHVGGRASGPGRDALLNMYMHTAHHRAQAIVYLRLNGIQPPEYQF